MPDLRRRALEGGKTISRKAQSREVSRSNSRTTSAQNSRHSSRAPSRYPSDDEDYASLSDDTAWSIASFDDLVENNVEAENPDWAEELANRIEEILDRKRSSVQGREDSLSAYCRLSKYHFVEDEIRGHLRDLLGAFTKSIKHESSVRETTLALHALELLTITANDDTIYDSVEPLLTRTIRDSPSNLVKAAAIHCLGACTFFGGAAEEDHLEQMNFFLDIASSDGHAIDAVDDPNCVTAALREWGFLATEVEDLQIESEDAIPVFMDQLESSEPRVQVAAGENIAFLYEKSYTPQEDDDEEDTSEDDDASSSSAGDLDGPKLIKRYNAYHNTPQLERVLQSLATVSGKHISKKDKKTLHSNFVSILTTVENPRRGPMYSTAIDQDTNRHYGSKCTVKLGREGAMSIDRWWKWIRLAALRRILQGGFVEHYYKGNRAVLDGLPIMVREVTRSERYGVKRSPRSKPPARLMAPDDIY